MSYPEHKRSNYYSSIRPLPWEMIISGRFNPKGLICMTVCYSTFNPCPAKLIYLNFHPLEVVSRYRDPQLQVAKNYVYLDTHFIPKNNDLVD